MPTTTSSSTYFRGWEMAFTPAVKRGQTTSINRRVLRCGSISPYLSRCGFGGVDSKTFSPELQRSATITLTRRKSLEETFPSMSSNGTVGLTRWRLKKILSGRSPPHPPELLSSSISQKEPTHGAEMRFSSSINSELSAHGPLLFTESH